jgi:dephospho-CoA kinase
MAPGGAAHADVVAAFGPAVLAPDGSIDRKALGTRVFADAGLRARLNAIVHPRVREEEERRTAGHAGRGGAVAVTDAALLVEIGVHLRFERLVVAHCPAETQMARLRARDGLDEASARARLAAQMAPDLKRKFGHYVIDTSGSIEQTDTAADRLVRELGAVASGRPGRFRVATEAALGALVHGPDRGPRGLEPARVLREAMEGGLEMERLARRLAPPFTGPWYEAGASGDGPPAPATLAVPVLLWSLSRVGPDAPFLASAMASVARLTHHAAEPIADAIQLALAAQEVVLSRRAAWGPADLLVWGSIAERWAGAPPSPRIRAALEAASAHPRDVPRAAAAARAAGADPSLAGGLVGLATGARRENAPADALAAVDALAASR